MSPISASLGAYRDSLDLAAQSTLRLAEGRVSAETIVAQQEALTLLDVQTELLEEALAAQTQLLDLLV